VVEENSAAKTERGMRELSLLDKVSLTSLYRNPLAWNIPSHAPSWKGYEYMGRTPAVRNGTQKWPSLRGGFQFRAREGRPLTISSGLWRSFVSDKNCKLLHLNGRNLAMPRYVSARMVSWLIGEEPSPS